MNHTPEELFASTEPYYRYRPGYAPQLYGLLVTEFSLNSASRVLDLGTGNGVLAIPLAAHAGRVVAVDPAPGMLDEGQRAAEEAGVTNIDWRLGDSTTLPSLNLEPMQLTVMGKAFHWMDRAAVAQQLDALVESDGGIALASSGAPGTLTPPEWQTVIDTVRHNYLGPQRRAGRGTYTHPAERHAEVLARSPFSVVQTYGWDHSVTWTTEDLVSVQFSYSYSSPAQLGEAKDAFAADLRAALHDHNPQGLFTETLRTEAILARRP